ncbi:PDR/VanB family oxidoreductase [Rhodococcus sp. NPDC019627]|uniref:PDR/VanB family oxidoreductase n=1 Tax=unclassified Rhodococcus (in: high G+C Gram-positive bacteria) TaxID=192944 RepID=UPI0033EC5BF2
MNLDLRVVERRPVADGIVELALEAVGGDALPRWEPGSHIDLHLGDGLIRQYSLTGFAVTDNRWVISVLREPNSRGGSVFVHDSLDEQSSVTVSTPRNHFALAEGVTVQFVAGGIGITPLIPMIMQLERERRDWKLFYAGRSRASMAYLDELAQFGDRVQIWPDDERGMPDIDGLVAATDPQTIIYSCGPEGLLAKLEDLCTAGPVKRTLRTERFVAKEIELHEPDHDIDVEFAQSGITVTVPADRTILSVAEENGIDILSSCNEGTCGTCETAVLEGIPDHRDSVLTDDERACGQTMMLCVSRARSVSLRLDA